MRLARGVSVLLGLTACAVAQSNDNYFQIRYFSYLPAQIASSSWADRITVDAQVNWNIPLDAGKSARVGFSLSNTNPINQAMKLEGTADFGYALLQYEGGIGGELGARKSSLTSLVAYNFPRSADPQAVQLLSNLNLIYMYQTDSASSGYTLNFADFGLRGALAQGWNWGAGYGFTQTNLNTQPLVNKSQQGRFEIRGAFSPLELASSTQFRANDNGTSQYTTLDQRLEGKLKMTDTENLSLNYHLAAQTTAGPQSDATLSLSTSRPKPFVFGANVGIRSADTLTWGANTSYQDDSYSASLEYAGVGGASRDHNLQTSLRYRTREWGWGLGLSAGATLEPTSGFWYGRIGGRIEANYKINPWNFSLRSSIDYQAQSTQYPLSSSLDLKGGYAATGFRFDAALNFNYRQDKLSGKATLTTLFGLSSNLDLNLSLDYLSLLTPVSAQQLGLGLGLRYGF